jgi:ubiquinone/menaquinone biosynthesis C-methylase UbiE
MRHRQGSDRIGKLGHQVVGIDISGKEIEIAKREAEKSALEIRFEVCDGLTLDFGKNVFDYSVIWAQTFGNLYSREYQLKMLAENRRVLKENGILCFSTHDREYVKDKYGQFTDGDKFYPYADSNCYWKLFTLEELKEIVVGAGLDVLFCGKSKELGKAVDLDVLVCVCSKGSRRT